MKIIPAIDINNGKCVRLVQGDFNEEKTYFDNPEIAAKKWVEEGAVHLHIVDLDGAKLGESKNLATVKKIKETLDIKIQYGGGIRSFEKAQQVIESGIDYMIIGTMAIKNPLEFSKIVKTFKEKVIVSLDMKDGLVALEGWKEKSKLSLEESLEKFIKQGIKKFLITDISKDGMLTGANVELYQSVMEKYDCDIIASGGVSSEENLEKLKAIGIKEVVVGKALYEGVIEFAKEI